MSMSSTATALRPASRWLFASLASSLALLCVAQAPGAQGQMGQPGPGADLQSPSATLEECVTAVAQSERGATFSGEMTAIPGSARMAMRVEVQERMPGEALFHTISAPGLGIWRGSDAGVKTYKYLKQVTNLSAPAVYRAAVRFRWLNARGRLIRHMERRTPECAQLAPPPTSSTAGAPPSATG
jgi:hypothetical protein